MAALQKTSLKQSCEVLVSIDLTTKVLATLNNFDSSKFHEEDTKDFISIVDYFIFVCSVRHFL